MSVSTSPLQACRTCEHGRELYQARVTETRAFCPKGHFVRYRFPEHENDDQHGFYRHCADHHQRAEVIDADKEVEQ